MESLFIADQKMSSEALDAKHKTIEFIQKNSKIVDPFDLSYFLYETLRT